MVLLLYYGNGRSNKNLEPISSEVALQPTDPAHPVKLGAHSIHLSLGVGYQLSSRRGVLALLCTIALASQWSHGSVCQLIKT